MKGVSALNCQVYWVWMHPRVRFTLRYNWSVRKQIFRFYAYEAAWQPGQRCHSPTVTHALAHCSHFCSRYLPDYKWTGTTLEPVANNRKEPMERFFPCEVHGPVPLHIAMLVALMNEILGARLIVGLRGRCECESVRVSARV